MKVHLVTTALVESWPKNGPVLFLGEWCKPITVQQHWKNLDFRVLEYHWDDRKKLYNDYYYLMELYERCLSNLVIRLNQLHSVSYSERYWRILIGPWLGYFIQSTFDRWECVKKAYDSYDIAHTNIYDLGDLVVPNDTAEFNEFYIDDLWNHYIIAEIHKYQGRNVVDIPWHNRINEESNEITKKQSLIGRVKKSIRRTFDRVNALFLGKNDCVLMATGLNRFDAVNLQFKLWQWPQFWSEIEVEKYRYHKNMRSWTLDWSAKNEYEEFVKYIIPKQLPKVYVEGYSSVVSILKNLPWPKAPKAICTSTGLYSDEVFKFWTGEKVDNNVPLFISQHGGHYGIGRWSFNEDHEKAICDKFLTWGWREEHNKNLFPVGQVKNKRPLSVNHFRADKLVLITAVVPRYSYWMYSVMVAGQFLGYLRDQYSFVDYLTLDVRDQVIVLMYSKDLGWGQKQQWIENCPGLILNDGSSDLRALLKNCRIFVSTYNATTFLESLTMNIPTVIFWNQNHWEIRDSAIPYFMELERVGIFHSSPESAALHINTIWGDVGRWWEDPDVMCVVSNFINYYSNTVDVVANMSYLLCNAASYARE